MMNKFQKVSDVSKFKLYSFKVTVIYRNTRYKIINNLKILVHFQVMQRIIN